MRPVAGDGRPEQAKRRKPCPQREAPLRAVNPIPRSQCNVSFGADCGRPRRGSAARTPLLRGAGVRNLHQPRRSPPRSAVSGLRRFATFNRLRRMSAIPARLFQDDLASVSISRLRASGAVTSDTKSVDVVFCEGDKGLRREVKVVHRRFPNGGEWSFFLCPVCSRPARILKLHGKPMCRRCCLRQGIGYRISSGSPVERDVARVARLHKVRELLDGGPARLHPRPGRKLDRRWSLTVSYRRGMIRERQDLLRLRREGLRLQ